MGWELRNGKWYYYRKLRRSRRVVSEYIGAGEFAQLIYLLDESDREQIRNTQNTWQKIKSENHCADMEIEKLNQTIKTLVRATLLASGHHVHKGQWRKTRNA